MGVKVSPWRVDKLSQTEPTCTDQSKKRMVYRVGGFCNAVEGVLGEGTLSSLAEIRLLSPNMTEADERVIGNSITIR
ncbi:unnamed protein product [Protopolystoma xenopodis]|uniref:Uncharacterized protein n=1 Tax=Protopolystoma xenopodis TaxID=117903 RepID=A0A448XIH1_9PLAT|nr:unnamed protein product [Protopolystoma xenopodis]